MGWTLSTFAVVVFGSAVVAAGVGVGALRRRPDPMALPLAVLMFAVAAWAVPHAIALGVTDVERAAFWHRMRYPGTVAAPVAYLVVALRYAGHERWLSRRTYALLGVVPALTVLAVWTNPYHRLFWQSLAIVRVEGASVFVPEFGPWYWANLGYLYLVTVVGLFAFASVVVRSGPIYRKQSVLMFVGGLVPLATNGVVNFAAGPVPTVDLTTTALAVTGLTFALALFHFDLLEVRPVARDRLVEELDDGVVVIGPNERVRDFNPTAARILGDIAVDQPAGEVLPSNVAPDGGELVAEVDGAERLFRTRSTPLTDRRGREMDRIVYLNDVTDIVEREQRISVLNRILRHNIRNELNVVLGQLDLLSEGASPDDRERVETAKEGTRQVLDFAEKARVVERTIRRSDAEVVVPVAAVVDRVVADARESHPDAIIECELPADGEGAARVVDGELLEVAIAELVENAVSHNDAVPPRVSVRVASEGERVRVAVADNGPGIPEEEVEAVNSRIETELEHGSGLGLWLVRWTVSLSAGDLSFAENDPRGTVAALSLRAA